MSIGNIGNAAFPEKDVSLVAPFGGVAQGTFPKMYTARLYAVLRNGEVIDLTTPLPENYQFNLATSFDNPFNQPLSNLASQLGSGIGQAVEAISTGRQMVTGNTTINKWLSGAVWNQGSLFTIEVPFVLQAYKSTSKEVTQMMKNMLKLVAPSENSYGFLTAPGPTMANASSMFAGDKIVVEIGEFFRMYPCIIENVTCEFDTQMDDTEHCPLSAVISITVKSYYVTTKQDLDLWFLK
jgi:hypothetical protein